MDFGDAALKGVTIRASSESGATLEVIMTNSIETKRFSVTIPASNDWNLVETLVDDLPSGIQHIKVVLTSENTAYVDWVQFN